MATKKTTPTKKSGNSTQKPKAEQSSRKGLLFPMNLRLRDGDLLEELSKIPSGDRCAYSRDLMRDGMKLREILKHIGMPNVNLTSQQIMVLLQNGQQFQIPTQQEPLSTPEETEAKIIDLTSKNNISEEEKLLEKLNTNLDKFL
ncbi:hypothetical protein B7C51_25090 (plasmid) [Paenibacillus larvae subsp. pulvifaciens]|uniref:Uncharacterized protein n=1 Tax=Paenibacillus larvae subsp. pulvifaciens TaxID=1477 RepID=A0A1V0V0S0_9BACL|nr:hypothetical protein [Paenibacillus larvae]ARF70750.1 hypothetical protein B7C51_25090 [Paenibacillus larvae subsp. pulvifaciens]